MIRNRSQPSWRELVQCQGIEPCEPKQPGYSRRPLHRGLALHWGDAGIRTLPVRVTAFEVPSTAPHRKLDPKSTGLIARSACFAIWQVTISE